MDLRPSPKLAALALLLALAAGCDPKKSEGAAPSATPTAPASAAAAEGPHPVPTTPPLPAPPPSTLPPGSSAAKAPTPPGGLACDPLLTAADIQATCGVALAPDAAPGGDLDIGGPASSCGRRFVAGHRSVDLLLTRYPSPRAARAAFDAQQADRKEDPEYKAVAGLGDAARRSIRISMTGDLSSTVDLVKGPYSARLFTPKVNSGGNSAEPVCSLDALEKLAKSVASRLP